MNAIDPAAAARNRQRVAEAARKAGNAARRRVVDLTEAQVSPVEPVRLGRDVEPAEWRDPKDANVQRRTPKVVQGHRRVDWLVRLRATGTVKAQHVAAGYRLRDDYELAQGVRMGERSPVRGSGTAGPGDVQLAAVARYRGAVQAVGQAGSAMVEHVVVHNRSLAAWCERRGGSAHQATGYFVACMDRLAEHYGLTLDDLRREQG